MLDTVIPKTCKKWPRQELEKPNFSKPLSMAFDKFWFLNFLDISIEKFAGINFVIAVIQFYSANCQHFSSSFLKLMCP